MGLPANYEIISVTSESVVIKDIGPWDIYLTVTNDAESVVQTMAPHLGSRRLYYIDSAGELDELVIRNGKFAGFAPGFKSRLI